MLRSPLRLVLALLPLLTAISAAAQQNAPRDSVVKELSAQSNELIEKDGITYRKVTGPARFLHNNTYLVCDTALWNVNSRLIEAMGNVQIIQDRTVLKSDRLDYVIDQDVAQFRGALVQLQDKDGNTLRTRFLDYNTRDSVAVFYNGGAMKDKDGQVIESVTGTYDSKIKLFTFTEKVNMYTDSIFIKTTRLTYDTDAGRASFGAKTSAWKEDNMLYADDGWYDRAEEKFLFRRNVHVMTPDQEGWADSLYYYSLPGNVEMLGHAQILDTTRDVSVLSGRMFYEDSLRRVTLTRDPVIIAVTKSKEGETEKRDTVWVGADSLVYQAVRRCDIPEHFVEVSRKRHEDMEADAVTLYRKTAYENAKRAAEELKKRIEEGELDESGRPATGTLDEGSGRSLPGSSRSSGSGTSRNGSSQGLMGNSNSGLGARSVLPAPFEDDPTSLPYMTIEDILQLPDSLSGRQALPDGLMAPADSLLNPADSLSLTAPADSLKAAADSLANVPLDTTRLGFVTAKGKVRVFRKDMQVRCNLLEYNDLDSLVRLYEDPVIWHEKIRQYTADSIAVMLKDRSLERASLMSRAFIVVQESRDTSCFDQIKGTDMMAFFDERGELSRFDVLGGAQLLFYLEENDTLATVNKAGGKMLSARLADGNIERIYYFDEPRSDAYPVVQLPREEKVLSGYTWRPSERPASPEDISPLKPRSSERERFAAMERPQYPRTDEYFPGYMESVRKGLARADSLKEARRRERRLAEQARRASLALADSLKAATARALADTLASAPAPADSLAPADTLAASAEVVKELTDKEKAKALKEQERAKKQAAREARWKVKDERDAAAKAAKEEKKRLRKRKKTLKLLQAQVERERKEQEKMLRYREKYLKKQAAKAAKAADASDTGK